ncbi:MAG: hypothetical protein KGZ60_10470 [Truepera sp.]|nr:hypothetical protein [Truepera sp.]
MFNLLNRVLALLLTLLLASTGLAQTLAPLLPAETILALGMQDLATLSDQLDDFRTEFERLDVAGALAAAFPMGAQGEANLPEAWRELDALKVLGQEAWVAVSASQFNPLPAVTLITRLTPEVQATVTGLLAEAQPVESFSESGFTFHQLVLEDELLPVLAYAQAQDLLLLSSNPDTLRGLLRRLAGAAEPNFASSAGYQATLGQLAPGSFYGYLNFAQLAVVARPFVQGFGVDALVARLATALQTAGSTGSVLRVTPTGLEQESRQVVNPQGGDLALYQLLTAGEPVSFDSLRFAPQNALSYTVDATNLRGWWDYLNDLAISIPELGGSLDQLLLTNFGLDLRRTALNWTGAHIATIVTAPSEVVVPGVAAENLLGENLFLLATTDEAAAQKGLTELLQVVSQTIAAFGDPMGVGVPTISSEVIGGVTVTHYDITQGVSLSYAVTGGYALIATSREAMRAVLETLAGTVNLGTQASYQALVAAVPTQINSLSFTDMRLFMEWMARELRSQLQLTAGLTGGAGLDFAAIDRAAGALEQFLLFTAGRLGSGIGYSQRSPAGIYSYSFTEVSW